jgi:hypothetical protein
MVENEPTVGKSPALSIVLFAVLNTKVALVRFALSKPPKIRMEEGPIWKLMAKSQGIQLLLFRS